MSKFPEDANEALRKSFPQRYKMLKKLSDAGAHLLIGTGTMVPYLVPGFTHVDESQRSLSGSVAMAARSLRASDRIWSWSTQTRSRIRRTSKDCAA